MTAHEADKRPEQAAAEQLAERYRAERETGMSCSRRR